MKGKVVGSIPTSGINRHAEVASLATIAFLLFRMSNKQETEVQGLNKLSINDSLLKLIE